MVGRLPRFLVRAEQVLLLLMLLFAMIMMLLLQLFVRKMLLVLKRLPLIPGNLVPRVLQDVFDFLTSKADRGTRDVERKEEIESNAAFPPRIRDVMNRPSRARSWRTGSAIRPLRLRYFTSRRSGRVAAGTLVGRWRAFTICASRVN